MVKLSSYPVGQLSMMWQGAWRPVCATGLSDSPSAAAAACKLMGYGGGKLSKSNSHVLTTDAVAIGTCNQDEFPLGCSGVPASSASNIYFGSLPACCSLLTTHYSLLDAAWAVGFGLWPVGFACQ